jgi:pheromone shutdown protein TraB
MNPTALILIVTTLSFALIAFVYRDDHQKRTETLYMILGATSFISLLIPAFWLTIGIATAQSPSFSLLPLIVMGIIAGLVSRRVYVVHNKLYGSYPA